MRVDKHAWFVLRLFITLFVCCWMFQFVVLSCCRLFVNGLFIMFCLCCVLIIINLSVFVDALCYDCIVFFVNRDCVLFISFLCVLLRVVFHHAWLCLWCSLSCLFLLGACWFTVMCCLLCVVCCVSVFVQCVF